MSEQRFKYTVTDASGIIVKDILGLADAKQYARDFKEAQIRRIERQVHRRCECRSLHFKFWQYFMHCERCNDRGWYRD